MNRDIQMNCDDDVVSLFLARDSCHMYADKYLLATVFVYFVRAQLQASQYTRNNFFVALFLSHDINEDEEEYKFEVLPWMYGENWRRHVRTLHRQRDALWRLIQCHAIVSRKCCEEVISIVSDHWCWRRERPSHHSGAFRSTAQWPGGWQGPFGPCRHAPVCLLCCPEDSSSSSTDTTTSSTSSSDCSSLTRWRCCVAQHCNGNSVQSHNSESHNSATDSALGLSIGI